MLGSLDLQDPDSFKNNEVQEFEQTFSSQKFDYNQNQIIQEEILNSNNQINQYRELLEETQNANIILKQVTSIEING